MAASTNGAPGLMTVERASNGAPTPSAAMTKRTTAEGDREGADGVGVGVVGMRVDERGMTESFRFEVMGQRSTRASSRPVKMTVWTLCTKIPISALRYRLAGQEMKKVSSVFAGIDHGRWR